MKNKRIIGSIDAGAGTFMFGQSDENFDCYKNPTAFADSSDEICYIPTNGAGSESFIGVYSLEDATTYTYADLEKFVGDFLAEHYPLDKKDVLLVLEWEQKLFDACDGDDPSTIIDRWHRSIDDERYENEDIQEMQEYVSNFDWNQNPRLLKQVYRMLP